MLRIRDYLDQFHEKKNELDGLLQGTDITAEQILSEMTPAERKIVDMLGGESMVHGIVNGTLNNLGSIELDANNEDREQQPEPKVYEPRD